MKSRLLFLSLAAAALSASAGAHADSGATPYAPVEFDFTEVEWVAPLASGIVERVEPLARDDARHGFAEAIEHVLRPEVEQRLLIRLEGGGSVTVVDDSERFYPGSRVRLLSGGLQPVHE